MNNDTYDVTLYWRDGGSLFLGVALAQTSEAAAEMQLEKYIAFSKEQAEEIEFGGAFEVQAQLMHEQLGNDPKRSWRARWSVDLEMATATHRYGWSFKLLPIAGEPGAVDARCIRQPASLTPEHLALAARITREAQEIYIEVRNKRQ